MTTITPTNDPIYIIAYTDDYEKTYFSKVGIGSSFHTGLNNIEQFASKAEMVDRLVEIKGTDFVNTSRVVSKLNSFID